MGVDVLVLGTYLTREYETIFISHGIRPAPADIVQKYLVHGLECNTDIESVSVISSPRIQSCFKNKLLSIKSQKSCKGITEHNIIGFINFPGIAFIQREYLIVTAAKEWAKKHKNKKLVLIYSIHSPFLHAAKVIKQTSSDIQIGVIVADLPQFMSKGNMIKRGLKKIDRQRIDSLLKYVDKYILYTKQMAEYFNLSKDKWIVCEGLIDTSRVNVDVIQKYDEKICVYAGSLMKEYAIEQLIEAFEQSNVNAKLYLYGDVNRGNEIIKKYPNMKKVEYRGMLLQEEILEVYRKATLLINPRPSSLELTKYSCPSKTFEYMLSGTPVLMTKLPGLPEEYYPYLYFFVNEDKEGFIEALEQVLSLPEEKLMDKGRLAASFIKREKNSKKQVKRIVDFCINEYKEL